VKTLVDVAKAYPPNAQPKESRDDSKLAPAMYHSNVQWKDKNIGVIKFNKDVLEAFAKVKDVQQVQPCGFTISDRCTF